MTSLQFENHWTTYLSELVRTQVSRSLAPQDVDDAIQETALLALEDCPHLTHTNIRDRVQAMARQAATRIRRRNHHQQFFNKDLEDTTTPETVVLRRHRARALLLAVRRLTPQQQQVVHVTLTANTTRDAAAHLGISPAQYARDLGSIRSTLRLTVLEM